MICSFGIKEFCASHGISRAQFYVLKDEGRAPRTYTVGRRRYVSAEAAAEWRRQMETKEQKGDVQ